MGLYYIQMDALSEFYSISIDDLKGKTYRELKKLEKDMKLQKAVDEQKRNAEDAEFARLVKKFFTPFDFLRKWWTEEEIIYTCSKHMGIRDLVEEYPAENGTCPYVNNEYIGEKLNCIPRYTRDGERLVADKQVKCATYYVTNRYQGGRRQGKVILELLYKKYPELEQFGFSAYGYGNYNDPYEIYPKNHIYTPFEALMSGNIEAIKKRNIEYGKSYNFGDFTEIKVRERLESEETLQFFEVIRNLK